MALLARMPMQRLMSTVRAGRMPDQAVLPHGLHPRRWPASVAGGPTPHTKEGFALRQHAAEAGVGHSVRVRDDPCGDVGLSTFMS